MSTSKLKKSHVKLIAAEKNRRVDRNVVGHYEKLVRETRGCFIVKRGADYRLAPPVGTSKLLAQSLLGKHPDHD